MILLLQIRFGVCEAYADEVVVCADVLQLGVDFVYISHSHGSQSDVTTLLNNNIETVVDLFTTHDKDCVDLVFRVICHYYFPSCGNITHTLPPHSMCQEECAHVQSTCGATWQAAALAFNPDPFINCSDTSRLLFPLPNCCTGTGITIPGPIITTPGPITSTATIILPTPSSPAAASEGATIEIVVTVVVLIIVAAVVAVVVLVIIIYRKVHRREQVKRVQMDILTK